MKRKISRWLWQIAVWLERHLPKWLLQMSWFNSQSTGVLEKLHPGERTAQYETELRLKKIMIVFGGVVVLLVFLIIYLVTMRSPYVTDYMIARGGVQASAHEVQLEAKVADDKQWQPYDMTITPRQYTKSERKALFEQVKAYIDAQFLGENQDITSVTQPLMLVTDYPGENITIDWEMADYRLIHQDGTLGDLTLYELPATTQVTAVITYGEYEESYSKSITVIQGEQTEAVSEQEKIKAAVQAADESTASEDYLKLPAEVDGKSVVWRYMRTSYTIVFILLGGIIIGCLLYMQEKQIKDQYEIRQEQLLCAYPGFVHQMVLMLGAGMTVRRSFEAVIMDFERGNKERNLNSYLYKEMKYVLIHMQAGMAEQQAYMIFGRRTELAPYMKFSQLLVQLLKRGTTGMQEMMLQEANEAEKQRRDHARRLGETAGTKLLLPMMLLLMLVLGIIMIPAFLSM